MIAFTIPLNPVTKKNNMIPVRRGKATVLIPSQRYREYEKKALGFIPENLREKIDYPINIRAYYFRDTRRRVDITNLESALMDLLVKAEVLSDDSAIPPIVVSTDGSRVFYDKNYPRTEVYIARNDEPIERNLYPERYKPESV